MLQRFVDPAAVAEEVERVRSLSGYALRRHWQAVFGRSAPKHLTAELRRRMLAMRIQEEAFGILDTAALKALDKLAGWVKASHSSAGLKLCFEVGRTGKSLVREPLFQG